MSVIVSKSETVIRLERDLESYDRIILVDGRKTNRKVIDAFCESEYLKETNRRILILSEIGNKESGNIVWRYTTEEEMRNFLKMYFLYEFSDRILLLSRENGFGGILNYIDTGILTMEEAVIAFLC